MSTNTTTSEIWFINTLKCLCDVLYAFFYHRKHSPAVPLEWKPLCVEQSDFHSAQYYCREALDWSGVFLLDSSSQSFLKVLYIFSLCIRFFVIHLWTSLCSLSCSEEYFLCLFVYSVKMDYYELLQDKKTTWMKGFKLHLYVLHFFLLNLFSQIY